MSENNLWLERWKNRQIGFNQEKENAFMMQYFACLNLKKESKVFVPLCGKTIDISWLLAEGYAVVGAELSEQAVIELFEELDVVPMVSKLGDLTLYSRGKLEVFVGDIFKVTSEMIGHIDAIYDRAALVALTLEYRRKYVEHLRDITKKAPQLLLCFEYEQSLRNGPPFAVHEEEVKEHYDEHYVLELLCREEIVRAKGNNQTFDVVWLLR